MSIMQIFYDLVRTAREQCGGDSMQAVDTVKTNIRKAIEYGTRTQVNRIWLARLSNALTILDNSTVLSERLKADTLLCEVLDMLDKETW